MIWMYIAEPKDESTQSLRAVWTSCVLCMMIAVSSWFGTIKTSAVKFSTSCPQQMIEPVMAKVINDWQALKCYQYRWEAVKLRAGEELASELMGETASAFPCHSRIWQGIVQPQSGQSHTNDPSSLGSLQGSGTNAMVDELVSWTLEAFKKAVLGSIVEVLNGRQRERLPGIDL